MAIAVQSHEDSLSDQIKHMGEAMQRAAHGRFFRFSPPDAWQPATNLYETKDRYVVCVDLAGVNREEIDVEVQQDVLLIQGQRESPRPQSRSKVHLMEIDHGNFRRTITIPSSVQMANIKARYVDGYLWVELPKGEK